MDEQPYPFRSDEREFVYRFEGKSTLRVVQKIVLITETSQATIFNLALLDELDDDVLSDTSVTDNDDLITVLATVFRIAADFLDRLPESSLVFRGSDARRDRLYRIALSRELTRLNQVYQVYGFNGEQFVLFEPNQLYSGFLIRKHT